MNNYGSQPVTPVPPPASSSKKWVWWLIGIITACLLLTCCIAVVGGYFLYRNGRISLPFLGGGLNPERAPAGGEGALNAGFTDDPFSASITGGGTIDASKQTLGSASGCVGFVASAPSYILNWSGTSLRLRLFSIASTGDDTTLIVRDPAGTWFCNDDAGDGGWDPMVDIDNPGDGAYAIWLGSYTSSASVQATLYATELDLTPLNPTGSDGSRSINELDAGMTPNFGRADLSNGFTPDPYTTDIVAGGPVDIMATNLLSSDGTSCNGFATSAPDFSINYTGSSSRLRIFFVPSDGSDTTLTVNFSSSNWDCNDDSEFGGIDPMVEITNPPAGEINIWVGTYSTNSTAPGTLYISEQDINPAMYNSNFNGVIRSDGGTLDWNLPPTYGSQIIESSTPTISVAVTIGGSVDVSSLILDAGCGGFSSEAPDFRFDYEASASRLRIFFVPEEAADTTLIVNTPVAEWACNDDDPQSGTVNPMVEFDSPNQGQYDVWVGTSGSSETISGTLYITIEDYDPSNPPK